MAGVYLVCALLVWMLPLIRSGAVTTDRSHQPADLRTGAPTVVVTESINYNRVPSPNISQQLTPAVSQAQSLLLTSDTEKFSNEPLPTNMGLRTAKTTGMPVGKMSAVTSMALLFHNQTFEMKGTTATKAETNQSKILNETLEIQTGTPPDIHVTSHSDVSTNTQTKTNVQFGPTKLSSTLNSTTADIDQPTMSRAYSQPEAPERFSTLQHSIYDPTEKQTVTVHPTSATPPTTQVGSIKAVSNNSAIAGVTASKDSTKTTIGQRGHSSPSIISTKTVTIVTTTKAIPKTNLPNGPPSHNKKDSSGIVVAVLIGGALLLMMVSFVVIFLMKRRRQSRNLENTAWAGPSPFLDEGAGHGGQVEMRVSNRISLSGFLPQRLSKRMSLLKEVEETKDHLTAGVTFGREKDDEETTENGIAILDGRKTKTQEIRMDILEAKETTLPSPTTDPEPVVTVSQFNSESPPPPPDPEDFISVDLDQTAGQEIHLFQPDAVDTALTPGLNSEPGQPLEQARTPSAVHDTTDILLPPLLDVDLETPSPSPADLMIPPAPPLPDFMQGHKPGTKTSNI